MAEEASTNGGVMIPISDNKGEKLQVVFYPDELPEDHGVLSDVLRGVFAPFKLEYHRQGFDDQFEKLLLEIVAALDDPDIDKLYQERDREEYAEGIIDIYVALAAKALSNYSRVRQTPHIPPQVVMDFNKKIVENLRIVDEKQRINEYTWLIRGFYEILQGDWKRAEDHFRYVHDRAAKGAASKRKYYFVSLVGMGVVTYAAGKYEPALSYFMKAVQTNPVASGATVRTAVALCCFKLEQYDRARVALEKSLSVDPSHAGTIVLLALVEQATAKKDRSKRAQCHTSAFEYCTLANLLEPGSPQTLNMLANHHFHSWRAVEFGAGAGCIVDAHHLMVPALVAQDLVVPKNLLRLRHDGATFVFIISEVAPLPAQKDRAEGGEAYVTVTVSPRIPARFLSPDGDGSAAPCSGIEVKDLAIVEKLAHQAMLRATMPAVLAESNYLLGKVAHSLRDANLAFDFYWKALKDAPDMTLAAFGAAEVLYSRREFQASLELFEKVLLQNPEDKDTQAYVALLKATLRNEVAAFDKLREIAPGFQHEVALWLLQGQLRQHDPAEHKNALKCYLNAKDCLEQRAGAGPNDHAVVPPSVLSNIAVLHHSLGKQHKALEFSRSTLLAVHAQSTGSPPHPQVVFRSAELEGVFYEWSREPEAFLSPGADADRFAVAPGGAAVDLAQLLAAGDEVVIAGVKHTVKSVVSASELVCSSPVKLARVVGPDRRLELRVKKPLNNFVDASVTYCFNFARLLEDDGNTAAATELYVELLKRHPSYMECYLRLSVMCCDLGKFDEATVWLSRALAVKEDEAEATLCLGDLYSRSGNLEEAKKCYDKICSANRHDSKAMLSLGNFYFAHHGGAKADSQLKESYKFFFHVLNENHNNAFAANGLGMVCAKKQELEVAREIFAKARESNVNMSEDICTNLAHVYLLQSRSVEAERLYQATNRSLARSGRSTAEQPAYLHECVASIQLQTGRFEAAARSVLRAIHLSPNDLRAWYNFAFVGQAQAIAVLAKASSPAAAIEDARAALQMAKKVFKQLSMTQHAPNTRPYDRKLAGNNSTSSSIKLQTLDQMLHAARKREAEEDAERRRREESHNAVIKNKSEQKEAEAQAAESEKLAKQQLAEQKERKLQELREKWTASIVEKAQPRAKGAAGKEKGHEAGGKKKRQKQRQQSSDDEGGADDGDDGDEDEALLRALNAKSDARFGSSDDDSDVMAPRDLRGRAAKSSSVDVGDLFGDSDDDADVADGGGGEVVAPSRKRLRRSAGGANADSDDELLLKEEDATSSSPAVEAPARKQQRIVDEDSD